uniref:Uncharacterized protein n=1 Tax=Arundo donax TaxID=35708 RepID=A0A0A9HRS4_ARUDO
MARAEGDARRRARRERSQLDAASRLEPRDWAPDPQARAPRHLPPRLPLRRPCSLPWLPRRRCLLPRPLPRRQG